MYLVYSYQYNKELLSKGPYRGHDEELIGHYRRECLLVSVCVCVGASAPARPFCPRGHNHIAPPICVSQLCGAAFSIRNTQKMKCEDSQIELIQAYARRIFLKIWKQLSK